MLRIPLYTLFILLSCKMSLAQPLSFRINGSLPADSAGYVYLYYPDSSGKWSADSSLLNKGKFQFAGKVYAPTLGRIFYKDQLKELFLESGTITLEGTDAVHAIAKGTKSNREMEELSTMLSKLSLRWKTVMDTLIMINKVSNEKFQELKAWVLSPYLAERSEIYNHFFDKHPQSYVTAYNLQIEGRSLSTDSLTVYYDHLSPAIKQSSLGKGVLAVLEKRKVGIPGARAANFSKKDINDSIVDLSSLKGKIVLLDFWGSWCVPCRNGHPQLKLLYAKFKDKGLEIIGVADDDRTPDAWRKAVQDDGLEWLQVLKGLPPNSIAALYNVTEYPTRILVSREGVILGRWDEELDELEKIIAVWLH